MFIGSSAKISEKHQQHLLNQYPEHTFIFGEALSDLDEYKEKLEILLTFGEDLQERDLTQFPNLKWIQVLSAGVERLPFAVIQQREILVTNARGIHRTPMAEYTLGLMLQHVRRFPTFFANQQKAIWDRSPRVDELAEKTIGVLGAGAIGGEIARKANAFDMRVIGLSRSGRGQDYYDQMYQWKDIEEFLGQCDFVVIILPLTSETKGLIAERELKMMKRTAVLINIARGAILVEDALITALNQGWIEAAYLDVFEEEPLPESHPYWKLKNCWLTPHVSGRSPYYMSRALKIFHENLSEYQQYHINKMQNRIDPAQGY